MKFLYFIMNFGIIVLIIVARYIIDHFFPVTEFRRISTNKFLSRHMPDTSYKYYSSSRMLCFIIKSNLIYLFLWPSHIFPIRHFKINQCYNIKHIISLVTTIKIIFIFTLSYRVITILYLNLYI